MLGEPWPKRIPLRVTASGDEVVPSALCTYAAIRADGNPKISSIHFFFNNDWSIKKCAGFGKRKNFIFSRKTLSQPHEMRCVRKFVECVGHFFFLASLVSRMD